MADTDTAQAVEEKNQENQNPDDAQEDSKTQAQSVEFSEAPESGEASGSGSITALLNMNVIVTIAIGQKQVPIRQLLQLGPGSILQLEKPIDSPVELYLKDTKFATGNVVVVDGHFGVRIKQIHGSKTDSGQPEQN